MDLHLEREHRLRRAGIPGVDDSAVGKKQDASKRVVIRGLTRTR